MSELATLARPYAAAVFKRARETGTLDTWSETLAFLAELLETPEVKRAAANPKLGKHGFAALVIELCGTALTPEAHNLIRLLAENGRLSLSQAIAVQFERYRAEEQGYLDTHVISAFPLDATEQASLSATLQKLLGKQLRLDVTVDRSLIGGVVVRAGDKVIDGSVKGQLQRLAARLHS